VILIKLILVKSEFKEK